MLLDHMSVPCGKRNVSWGVEAGLKGRGKEQEALKEGHSTSST